MTTVKTIDITPTVEEATRIYAYVFSNVSFLPVVLKDYWAPTEDEAVRIRDAWTLYSKYLELSVESDYTPTNGDKRKWSRIALKKHGFIK